MMSRIYLVIVLLILLAAAIGVLVFMQSNKSLPFSVTNQSQPSTSPYPNIESLLKPQEASPSAQQVEEYVTAVEKFAEEGDLVTLANACLAESQSQQRAQRASEVILGAKCISAPSVLKTKAGEALKFKNNTKEEIRLFFPMTNIESSKGYFVLQAGRSTVVSLDFKPGVFSYTCHTPKDSNTYSKDILFE